jgi:hypothetical protein
LTEGWTTYQEAQWSPMGDLPATALLLLAAVLVGGYFMGKRLKITGGWWLLVWAFPFIMGRAAYEVQSSLSGWLMLLGGLGLFICGWWTIRARLPVQPLADEQRKAPPVAELPESGEDWNAAMSDASDGAGGT